MQHHVFHIVAASGDVFSGEGVIGRDNQLPWPKNPQDLKFFKATTLGNTVIMGRKTFESIGKALPERENIVLSRTGFQAPESVKIFHSLEEAVKNASYEKVFIVGGGELYKQSIDLAEGIYLTAIEGTYSGDTKYPPIPKSFQENKKKSETLQGKFGIPIIYLENESRQF